MPRQSAKPGCVRAAAASTLVAAGLLSGPQASMADNAVCESMDSGARWIEVCMHARGSIDDLDFSARPEENMIPTAYNGNLLFRAHWKTGDGRRGSSPSVTLSLSRLDHPRYAEGCVGRLDTLFGSLSNPCQLWPSDGDIWFTVTRESGNGSAIDALTSDSFEVQTK